MKLDFTLAMTPPRATHQEKGVTFRWVNGKPVPMFYERKALKEARRDFMVALEPFAPEYPLEGAIRLKTLWTYPRGKHKDGEPKTTKPDTDNMIKLLKDCMTQAGFWYDDAQVCDERIGKVWGDDVGIRIVVEQIKEEVQE